MRVRVYNVIGTGPNPDIGAAVKLATELDLHPRDISPIMGYDAIEIFIPEDKFGSNDGQYMLKQFRDLGYEVKA